MTEGTDRETVCTGESNGPAVEPEALAAVGSYEEGEDVVLYDTENPLAWMQARETVAIDEMV